MVYYIYMVTFIPSTKTPNVTCTINTKTPNMLAYIYHTWIRHGVGHPKLRFIHPFRESPKLTKDTFFRGNQQPADGSPNGVVSKWCVPQFTAIYSWEKIPFETTGCNRVLKFGTASSIWLVLAIAQKPWLPNDKTRNVSGRTGPQSSKVCNDLLWVLCLANSQPRRVMVLREVLASSSRQDSWGSWKVLRMFMVRSLLHTYDDRFCIYVYLLCISLYVGPIELLNCWKRVSRDNGTVRI